MGRAAGIRHEALEGHSFRGRHLLRQFDSGLAVRDPLARHAGKYRDRDLESCVGRPGSLLDPIDHLRVIHHEHERRIAFGERHGTRDIVDAGRLLGPQYVLNAGAGHQFRLRHGGAGQADGAFGYLAFGDVHALVDLDVGANVDARCLTVRGHLLDVVLEQIEIDDHAGCRQNIFGDVAEIAASDARFEFRIGERAALGLGAAHSRSAQEAGRPCHE